MTKTDTEINLQLFNYYIKNNNIVKITFFQDKSNINRLENDKNGYRDQLTTVEASMIRMRTELEEKNVYLDRLLAEVSLVYKYYIKF